MNTSRPSSVSRPPARARRRFASLAFALALAACTAPPDRGALAPEARAAAIVAAAGIAEDYPFEPHFVSTPMGAMHYVDEGEGDPVLLLHGNPSWSYLYREFVPTLSATHRVVAPDHVGFGLSDKPSDVDAYSLEAHVDNLEALVLALDLTDITLVMQDWGGPIGLGVAARHPERVRALVVMNTFGFYPPVDGMDPENVELPLPLDLMRTRLLGGLMVRRLGMFERVAMPSGIADGARWDAVKPAYEGVFESAADRAGVLAFPRMIPTRTDHPSAAILLEETGPYVDAFDGPALIFWGMRDPFFPVEALAAWRTRLPRAEVIELPDAKHFVQEDAPDVIVPRLAAFLTSFAPSR